MNKETLAEIYAYKTIGDDSIYISKHCNGDIIEMSFLAGYDARQSDLAAKDKRIEELRKLLIEVKELTDTIVDSSPNTTIKGKIESMALMIGHHPLVLNVLRSE